MSTEPTPPEPAAPEPTAPEATPINVPPIIESNQDDRTMAMLCHFGGILTVVVPLVIWILKKDQSKFVDDQGKEAVNFQIIVLIALAISALSCFIWIGVVLFPAVYIANIVFCIIAGMAANQGQVYRYPFGIRLIK